MTRGPLIDLAYVRLAGKSPERETFLTQIMGLQKVEGRNGDLAFRSDDRYHTVAVEADDEAFAIGVEVDDDHALERLRASFGDAGFSFSEVAAADCERRFVRRAIAARDGSGNRIDFVVRPARSGRRYFGTRDAGVLGLAAVGIRSLDIARDTAFWLAAGAIVSDRVGEITYLRFDALHHRIALYPSERNGLLYATFAVESLDCIMQNFYHLQERQIRILHGPGRETASGQNFVRFADSQGQMFAFGSDMIRIDESRHRPRQFTPDRFGLCAWGSECREAPELSLSSV